jgi:ankyrin repeat protein
MKRLSTELKYLINRLLFGIVIVPGILWSATSVLEMYTGRDELLPATDYYLRFYGNLDNPLNLLWVAAPYLVFLLVRPRNKATTEKQQVSLQRAVSKGQDDTVKTLIEDGADIQAANVRGQAPLHLASMTDNVDMVRTLVDKGADVDVKDPADNIRPLHNCAINDCIDVCEFLLKHGADMDAQTRQGDTALHLAAKHGNADLVSLLLGYHADYSLRNRDGLTAEQIASSRSDSRIVRLIQNQANSEWQYPRMVNSKA